MVIAAVVGAAIGAGLGYGPLLHYRSEGVLGMDLAPTEYKRISEMADAPSTLRDLLKTMPLRGPDAKQIAQLDASVAAGGWHTPIPRISNADVKDVPAGLLQQDNQTAPAYLGVRLNYTAHDPLQAAQIATWLGAYFKDVAAHEALETLVLGWAADNRKFADQAAEQRLNYAFEIEQAQSRAKALKALVASYPEAAGRDTQPLFDVRGDNAKYLPPLAQLIGAESEVIDINEKLLRLDRRAEQENFARPLISDARAALDKATSGSDAVLQVAGVVNRFVGTATTDAQKEKVAAMASQLSAIGARFLSRAQLVAVPYVPTRPQRPGPTAVIVAGALLAALLAAAIVWRRELIKMLREQDEPTGAPHG